MKMDEILDEIELFINLKINHNLTESDIKNINIMGSLKTNSTTRIER